KAKLMVPKDASREELEAIAMADAKVQAEIAGKDIVKVIAVPNKLVNIVVK
ncbi:class I tRNA ligase family protein, partial [Streptococcus pyogenes]